MYPIPWKSSPISFDMPFLHLSSSGPLMRCQYFCAFPISGQITELALHGFNVRFPVTWLMTAQSYPNGRTRGAGLLGLEGEVLIVATWLAMRSCSWRRFSLVLYRCFFGILCVSAPF